MDPLGPFRAPAAPRVPPPPARTADRPTGIEAKDHPASRLEPFRPAEVAGRAADASVGTAGGAAGRVGLGCDPPCGVRAEVKRMKKTRDAIDQACRGFLDRRPAPPDRWAEAGGPPLAARQGMIAAHCSLFMLRYAIVLNFES
jgi:hypothetical protein